LYSLFSIGGAAMLVHGAVTNNSNYYDTVITLCSSKLNMVLLLNCLFAIMSNAGQILIYVFFTSIR